MLTTLASYRLISANLSRQLTTTTAQPLVAHETQYYEDNIKKVKSVDDFLNDHRLFAYAMKAYGLEDMTSAKAFMKKVLESDLSDDKSFANQLSDTRYREFAQAFHFLSSGNVDLGLTTAQDSASEDAMIGLYSQQRIDKGTAAGTEAQYYQSQIGNITSVDQLLSDQRLFDFALTAYGIDPSIASVSAIRNVLTSNLSDPNSVANVYGGNYQKLAAAFSFQTDGSVASGGTAQTSDQASQTVLAYYQATGTDASPAAAAFESSYFKDLIGGVTNVDDLVNNDFMRSYVATAAGLDPSTTTAATLRGILVSDLSDPNSAANAKDAYKAVAQAFNFNTDGSLNAGVAAQDAGQQDALANLFLANYDVAAVNAEQTNTSYYKNNIGNVLNVDDFLASSTLYNFVLSAYGIDPSQVTKSQIKQVLLSDPTNASSYASLQHDSRFTALAAAFNFDSKGNTLGVKLAQTRNAAQDTITRYTKTLGSLQSDQTAGKIESQYYAQTIPTVSSVDDLLKDQRLKTYIIKAFGLDTNVSDTTLRKVLTSDSLDPKSFANQSNNAAYKDLAAAFNFNSDGTVARSDVGVAQDRAEVAATRDLYVRQTMEQDVGNDNEGARLALYFSRKASSITSAYQILGDKALLQVAETALDLPQSISLLDIDKEAKLITSRLNLTDFQDPAKVDKFLTRFSAMWDINNPSTSQASPATILLQPVQASVSQDLLSSLQNLKLGGV